LIKLQNLYLDYNPHLKLLPSSLSKLTTLENLSTIACTSLTYPPKEIQTGRTYTPLKSMTSYAKIQNSAVISTTLNES